MSTPALTVGSWPAFSSTRQKGASPTAMDCRWVPGPIGVALSKEKPPSASTPVRGFGARAPAPRVVLSAMPTRSSTGMGPSPGRVTRFSTMMQPMSSGACFSLPAPGLLRPPVKMMSVPPIDWSNSCSQSRGSSSPGGPAETGMTEPRSYPSSATAVALTWSRWSGRFLTL
ncbi:hypothetical protein [Streptomyces sp. NK15101]|uniref:hypothetical protein n=1 Tax=Streptomyces sp. NK15101 TaxID=2873261 RepID=UPI001CED78DF|nr:hypothetical protein [Streptomyces sp. NK15101]